MDRTLRQISEIQALNDRFRQLCELYAAVGAREGVRIRPYRDPSVPAFSSLPEDRKHAVIAALSQALECFEDASAAQEALRDSPRLLWRALRKLGLTPRSDLFDKIRDTDVINCFS